MNFNIKGHLSPSQAAVAGFIGKTSKWLTVREIAQATGIAEGGAWVIVKRLEQLGRLNKRRRQGGFDHGILEYRRSTKGEIPARPTNILVVPLATKLREFLPADRAREAENY